VNPFTSDPEFIRLLEIYLQPDLLAQLRPRFERLGAQAGSAERAALARLTIGYRLQPQDPLGCEADPALAELEELLLAEPAARPR
jgi:hypothetical protein